MSQNNSSNINEQSQNTTDNNIEKNNDIFESSEFSMEEMNYMFDKYNEISNTTYDLEGIKPMKKIVTVVDICVQCETNNYLIENQKEGVLVCSNCGIVVKELFDENAEWRNYDGTNSNNVRTSGVINYYLPITSMKIGISGTTKSFLKKANSWSGNNYTEKKRMGNMCYIKKICEKNKIKKCIEDDAIILYCKMSGIKHSFGKNEGKNIIMRGQKKTGFIAACIFHSFKKNKEDKLNKDIAKMFGIPTKIVTDGIKKFRFLLNSITYDINTMTSFTSCYIDDFCSRLGVTEIKHIELAHRIARNMRMIKFLSSHKPVSIAAIIVYVVIQKERKEKVSKKFVSTKLGISEVTLNKPLEILEKNYSKLIDDNYVIQYKEKYDKKLNEMKLPQHIIESYESLKKLNPTIFDSVGI